MSPGQLSRGRPGGLEELEGIGSEEQGREEEARAALEINPSRQQHHHQRAAASTTTRTHGHAKAHGNEAAVRTRGSLTSVIGLKREEQEHTKLRIAGR